MLNIVDEIVFGCKWCTWSLSSKLSDGLKFKWIQWKYHNDPYQPTFHGFVGYPSFWGGMLKMPANIVSMIYCHYFCPTINLSLGGPQHSPARFIFILVILSSTINNITQNYFTLFLVILMWIVIHESRNICCPMSTAI